MYPGYNTTKTIAKKKECKMSFKTLPERLRKNIVFVLVNM